MPEGAVRLRQASRCVEPLNMQIMVFTTVMFYEYPDIGEQKLPGCLGAG